MNYEQQMINQTIRHLCDKRYRTPVFVPVSLYPTKTKQIVGCIIKMAHERNIEVTARECYDEKYDYYCWRIEREL